MLKVLVFGANGYLGSNCVKHFTKTEIFSDTFTNISSFSQVLKSIEKHKPDWVLNCAAKTDEDKAEEDINYWQEMLNSNLMGAINILKACHILNVNLCHIRTPFETSPIDDYSLTKISANEFISAEKYKDMVLSITPGWFFGSGGRQFDSLLIRSVKEGFPLGITNNSVCTPVYMVDFVKELENFLVKDIRGNHNLSGLEGCTRYEFAQCLANELGKSMSELNWTENNNFKESAKRPKNWRVMGYLRTYKNSMKDFVKENF